MGRAGIRYEDVSEAAETLLSRGLNPTIQRVRELLGTGSNTTISDHLKRWQQTLAESPHAILPPAIPEAVAAALESFWRVAVQQAEAAFVEQRLAAEQAVAAAEQARTAALEREQQAIAEAEAQRQARERTEHTARELQADVLREQERRAAAAAAITAAEQRAAAAAAEQAQVREEATARLAQLDALLHQLRRDHEHQRTEAEQRLAAEQARGEANETRLMRLLDQLRTEHAAERQVFTADRQDWRQRETIWQTQLTAHQREAHEALRAQAIAEDRQQALRAELERARAAQQASEERYRQAVHEQQTLRAAFDTAQQQCQALQDRLEQLKKQRDIDKPTAPAPESC